MLLRIRPFGDLFLVNSGNNLRSDSRSLFICILFFVCVGSYVVSSQLYFFPEVQAKLLVTTTSVLADPYPDP